MPEKRKSITRARTEAARKKVQSSTKSPPPEEDRQSEPRDEPLPVKITNGAPLPTIRRDSVLPDRSLQSVAESGVLAASLDRSRERWLSEALFDKYWTKPSKKKGYKEDPKNPARDTMQKAGACKITIEPHVLDATIFAIKAPQGSTPSTTPSSSTPVSMANPIMQYSPSTSNTPAAYVPQQSNLGPGRKAQASFLPPNSPAPLRPSDPPPGPPASSSVRGSVPVPQSASPAPPVNAPSRPTVAAPLTQQPPPKQPSQDPVIQMLAQRASTNPDLKVLMKIVASGSANGEQLKVFQGHIDDLTSILARERESAKQKSHSNAAPHITTPLQNDRTTPQTPIPAPQQVKMPSTTFQQPAYFQPQTTKKSVHSTPKIEVSGVAIEFTAPGSSGDRFLFPKDSILEFVPSLRQVIASFLIVRKPDVLSGGKYTKSEKYYQPITMRITSEQPKVFEVLARSVNPAEEVRKRMEEIIASTKRADNVLLALQLPLEQEDGETTETPGIKPTDKRQSITKTQGPVPLAAASQKSKDRPNTWQDLHCQFCLTKVSASPQKLREKPVCQPCMALLRADMFRNPLSRAPLQTAASTMDNSRSGPQSLML